MTSAMSEIDSNTNKLRRLRTELTQAHNKDDKDRIHSEMKKIKDEQKRKVDKKEAEWYVNNADNVDNLSMQLPAELLRKIQRTGGYGLNSAQIQALCEDDLHVQTHTQHPMPHHVSSAEQPDGQSPVREPT